jgi:hypothetical protein
MLGNQKRAQNESNSQNPFQKYQTFYLNLFSNVEAANTENYKIGVNDSVHFRCSLRLDDYMKSNSDIMQKNQGKNYYSLPSEQEVGGFLKGLTIFKEEIKGKPAKKIQLTLFDPNAIYVNPFGETIDKDNPLNGTVVGAIYIIRSSFTLKGKELIRKLANIDQNANDQMISIIAIPAKTKDSGYKEQMLDKSGKKIYTILVKQGDTSLRDRFGDPEKSSYVINDEWNKKYLDILSEYEDDALRTNMDVLLEKYTKNVLIEKINGFFMHKLHALEYDLVENGLNEDGSVKYKYVKMGETLDISNVANYVEPTNVQPKTTTQVKSSLVVDDEDSFVPDIDDEDLPF